MGARARLGFISGEGCTAAAVIIKEKYIVIILDAHARGSILAAGNVDVSVASVLDEEVHCPDDNFCEAPLAEVASVLEDEVHCPDDNVFETPLADHDSDEDDRMLQMGQDLYDDSCAEAVAGLAALHVGPKLLSHESTDVQADEDVAWPHFLTMYDIFTICNTSRASRSAGHATLGAIMPIVDWHENVDPAEEDRS